MSTIANHGNTSLHSEEQPVSFLTRWNLGNLEFSATNLAEPRRAMPLVVLLHGCKQDATEFGMETGWIEAAKLFEFALLLVGQKRINNADLCFNWFSPLDNRRNAGEAASIAGAVSELLSRGAVDPKKIFITGLSAGGAMTSVMLACYPELFSAGGIIGGLPYGISTWAPVAAEYLTGERRISSIEQVRHIRSRNPGVRRWPRVSIWHGDDDDRVSPVNASDTVSQWLEIHRLRRSPHQIELVGSHEKRNWFGRNGKLRVEEFRLDGFGHALPIAPHTGLKLGRPGKYVQDTSISSTEHLIRFFGLDGKKAITI